MKTFKVIFLTICLSTVAFLGWKMTTTNGKSSVHQDKVSSLIPRDLLFGNPEKALPQLSSDGKLLAYLAPNDQNVLNVWIQDLSGVQKDRLVTSDEKRGIRSFLWQFDDQHILYIQDRDGDENWHLYQTNIETKETRDLTPYEGAKTDIVEYDPQYPHLILVQINHRNKSESDVYKIDLKTGEIKLDTENFGGIFHWVTDNQLNVRVAHSYSKEGNTLIHVRETVDSPWREFLSIDPNEIGGSVVGFSPDNQSIYLISSLGENNNQLFKINLATGQREVLFKDSSYDLSSLMIHPTTHVIEAAGIDKERFEWVALDSTVSFDLKKLEELYGKSFKVVSRDLADTKWIIASISDQRPVRFYLYHRDDQTAKFLFSTQASLEKYTLSPMTPISFEARDGMKIHGYLTLPIDKEPRDLPTVLLVHGGPWVRDSWGLQPTVQWLANRGYAVLQINYRGSTGYGKDYVNAGNHEWAGKMHTDLLDGKKWVINQGYADPHKIAIYGGSYGGYATLVGLTFTPDEFCCGVDIVGPSNLITLLQTFPPYWAPLKAQTDKRLGSLEKDAEFLKERSPLFKADQIKKPLLIAQGANDPRVKQAESDQIVEVMRKNQLPVEYLLFSDEGHGFARPINRLKFCAAAEEFLSQHLGGPCQASSLDEDWNALKK